MKQITQTLLALCIVLAISCTEPSEKHDTKDASSIDTKLKKAEDIDHMIKELCDSKGMSTYRYYSEKSENALYSMLRDTILKYPNRLNCGVENKNIIALSVGSNQTQFEVNSYDLAGETLTIGIKTPTQGYSWYDSILNADTVKTVKVNYQQYGLGKGTRLKKTARYEKTVFNDKKCSSVEIKGITPNPEFTMVYIIK